MRTTDLNKKALEDIVSKRAYNNDIEHRMEWVREYNGVDFINDSKATDVHASLFSLSEINVPVNWILMESENETDYTFFQDMVQEKVKSIVYIGERIPDSLNSLIKVVDCFAETSNLKKAIEIALEFSNSGEVVLFSPASASFHFYTNYKERGNDFKNIVNQLR
jgi:UDP-N-acetylmuramoylalanine--D-glutamate ligase